MRLKRALMGRHLRRAIIRTVAALLTFAGIVAGAAAGYAYYDRSYGRWVGVVAVLIGLGTAIGSWFVAALLSLYVEIADSLRSLVETKDRVVDQRKPPPIPAD